TQVRGEAVCYKVGLELKEMADAEDEKPASNLSIEQELRQKNEDWVRALVNADGATLNRIMADDCVFTHPLEGDDKAQFVSDVESGELRVEYMNRDRVDVRIYGDTAVISCRDDAKWLYGGREISGIYRTLHVYAKRAEGWQLVAVQACPVTHP
ncbi:MAG TPA: nuclear transport factor 2 family protein, partial [Pyrinomonadaceae bacterium]|nr:nuclear transport factor 2 family protein [Pyrinomonadaceae bacterium]